MVCLVIGYGQMKREKVNVTIAILIVIVAFTHSNSGELNTKRW